VVANHNRSALGGPWRLLGWLVLVAYFASPVLVVAQVAADEKLVLAPGDQLTLTVPGHGELSQEVVLDAAGDAVIVPVGAVHLAGLRQEDAEVLIQQKLRLLYTTLDYLQLEVARTGQVRIYVIGRVGKAGVLTYPEIPTLWDVVRSIGGPLDDANLREARVIRELDGKAEVHLLDLSGMMEDGELPYFRLRDGDTLVVPSLQEGIPGVDAAVGVKVFGSVGVPTIVPVDQGTPLMDVLMLAGAPLNTAKTSKIHWVHNDGVRNQATIIDLEKYLLTGDETGNPLVYPGDTINVEFIKPSWVRQNVPFVLGSLAAMATIYLAIDSITNRTVIVR